ncbi:glycosyltransferase [Isoptericola croceus]|uniref:glycosyltransferase n=1 Tax=Isoptericola croceus TaxID=3031406 RepID=UPI0023F66238|nr:glycosyltransferase [Isoptericola croceus]
MSKPTVAIAHDYLTQRGGAERVALTMAQAFPDAPLYTSLYDQDGTFPEFSRCDVRTSRLDRSRVLRSHHRLALPLLARAVEEQPIEADVLLASSSGWAHRYRGAQRTVVYCYAPARWLYQQDRYLSGAAGSAIRDRVRTRLAATALRALGPGLRSSDIDAAARAHTYLTTSTEMRRMIKEVYGIDAEIVPPPPAVDAHGPLRAVPGLRPGYLLCVARLLPYKNVDVVVAAARRLKVPLVVVGEGPDRGRLERLASDDLIGPADTPGRRGGVHLLGRVDDEELRWLYANAALLVATSYEDYGLTPLEGGAFGLASVTLGTGGYLDTVIDGVTGLYVGAPDRDLVASAVESALERSWDESKIRSHVQKFSRGAFVDRLRTIVARETQVLGASDHSEQIGFS